ncbi:MAG: hypothetical protein EBZ07_01415 [Verrucomicrobia bacterium]|nr:hypothetical protein [Verrucomicrobiota bacterium]
MGLLIPLLILLGSADLCLAPPLNPRTQPAAPSAPSNSSTNTDPNGSTSAPPPEDSGESEEVRKPIEEKVMRATLPAAHTPARHGETEGPYLIGQRTLVDDYCGWGWVRKEGESWNQARWVAIEYNPKACPPPHSFLPRPQDDKDYLYKLYGAFAPYRAYEPQADVWVDVLQIKGFVSLGPAKESIRKDPPAHGSAKPNRFAERGANIR